MPHETPLALQVYDDLSGRHRDHTAKRFHDRYGWPVLRRLVDDVDGTRVLDAGCGTGRFGARLAERGADLDCVDPDGDLLDRARERIGPDASYRQSPLDDLGFADDGTYDLVVCQLALGYVREWLPVFEEFHRVLDPEGTLAFTATHPLADYAAVEHRDPGAVDDETSYFVIDRVRREWDRGRTDDAVGAGPDDDASNPESERVPLYRRPLSGAVVPALAAGFVVDGVVEPTPVGGEPDAVMADDDGREGSGTAAEGEVAVGIDPPDHDRPPEFVCLRARMR